MKVAPRLFVACCLAGAAAVAQSQQLWDAAADFSISSNPNGAWSYGYISGNTFATCTSSFTTSVFAGWNNDLNGQATIMQNICGVSSYGVQPGHLSLECDFSAPILRFTVPTDGLYLAFLQVGGTTEYQNGGFGNAYAGYASLEINGVAITEDSFVGNVKTWFTPTLALSAGDTIQAVMGNHYGGGNNDTTMWIESVVPEPSSFLGLLAFTPLLLRRRRR